MNNKGVQVGNKFITWPEVYKLTGCTAEDFKYDSTGECYRLLEKSIGLSEHDRNIQLDDVADSG